jgi:hypothetical protein
MKKMAKTELFEKPPAKEAAVEVKEEKPNGDFNRLMNQDVALKDEIRDILNAEGGACNKLNEGQRAEYASQQRSCRAYP